MAGPGAAHGAHAGGHPIHIHPARPLYRFFATALPASMWFFVRLLAAMKDVQNQEWQREGKDRHS